MGSTDTWRDIPRLLGLYASGDLLLDELVSQRIGLGDVELAFDAMDSGTMARSLVVFDR